MLRAFDKEQDFEVIASWIRSNGSSLPDYDMIPDTGYVYCEGDIMASACLYYATNTNLIFGEYLTVNPELTGEDRSRVIDEVMIGGALDARAKGLLMFCRTSNERVKLRLEKNGFRHIQDGLSLYCF